MFVYRERKLNISDQILKLHQEHEPYTELDETSVDRYLEKRYGDVDAFLAKKTDEELSAAVADAILDEANERKQAVLNRVDQRWEERAKRRKAAKTTEKQYRIRYEGKYVKVKRQTGNYAYLLYDNPEDVPAGTRQKMQTEIAMMAEDCGIKREKIELVEVS